MAPEENHIASGDMVRRDSKGLECAFQPAIAHVDREKHHSN